MIKINKSKARRLFNEGVAINLLPCKVRLNSMWIKPCLIEKKASGNFDDYVDEFEHYNCNYELGYYTSYYISE